MNKDQLKAAFAKGARIQAWHLLQGATNSNQGQWDTITPKGGAEPEFGCEAHLYRVHPEDITLISELGQEVGAVAVPEGWALVPQQMAISPEALGIIETMCGGPDNEGIGGEGGEDRWVDGLLWVGETIGDDGEKYWGLNIACAECLDEGSLPIVEFDRQTSPAHTSEARDAVLVPRDVLATEARRLIYRASECWALDPKTTDAGAQMIATAAELQRWADKDAAMRQEGGSDE